MIKIKCPHCQEANGIRLPNNSECRHCKHSLDNNYFYIPSKKSIAIGATSALLAGAVVGYMVENSLDVVRYPIRLEYAIITQCATPNPKAYMTQQQLQKNIEMCTCALEKTTKNIGYKEEVDEEMKAGFRDSLHKCK